MGIYTDCFDSEVYNIIQYVLQSGLCPNDGLCPSNNLCSHVGLCSHVDLGSHDDLCSHVGLCSNIVIDLSICLSICLSVCQPIRFCTFTFILPHHGSVICTSATYLWSGQKLFEKSCVLKPNSSFSHKYLCTDCQE